MAAHGSVVILMGNSENNENKEIVESVESVENAENAENAEKTESNASGGKVKHKRLSNYERHLVPCPHCGKDILDHFTECPHCGGAVDPLGYHCDEKKLARVKRISTIVGVVLSIGLIAAIIAVSYVKSNDKTDSVTDVEQTAICRETDTDFS